MNLKKYYKNIWGQECEDDWSEERKKFLGGNDFTIYPYSNLEKGSHAPEKNAPSTSSYIVFSNFREFSKPEEGVHAYLGKKKRQSLPILIVPFDILL